MNDQALKHLQACGEAPGRLDFMGGVADYSGSLVLQTPIQTTTRVRVTWRDDAVIAVRSTHAGCVRFALEKLRDFADVPVWARYITGCIALFCNAFQWQIVRGLTIEIESDIPTSMGVSSSAALEVATLRALENLSGLRFSGTALAKLAQRAENEIVGAPCGLMDQLASSHGVTNALLPILCRPDILHEPIALPSGVLIVGWPSGVKHATADSPYATARCAAFMGKKILEKYFNAKLEHLTEISPSQLQSVNQSTLPDTLSGEEFLAKYGNVDDRLSVVDPKRTYPLRAGVRFPVEENFRCGLATLLLRNVSSQERESTLRAVGELMFQSDEGYSSIGLGCPETDAIVEAIRCNVNAGFYGARVSGGGSGGTVVMLLEEKSLPLLQELAAPQTLIQ